MKRILPHPARPERPTMWRSMAELENTPDFEETLQREFPRGAGVYEDSGLSKREFLKLMGASMALAGVGLSGCRRPPSFIVPLKEGVEWAIPGKFLYYSTAMPTRLGAIPLIATTVDGRPTKVEGNPIHPSSNGGTDGFAQASVLDLYDPHRKKEITFEGKATDAAALEKFLADTHAAGGNGLAILADGIQSPTRDRLRDEIERALPGVLWAEYEPLGAAETNAATTAAFGPGVRLVPDFARADVILALDSDFLNTSETGVGYAAEFYPRRDPENGKMNRLYVVENHYSNTGGLADHRLRLKASDIGAFAAALAAKIGGSAANLAASLPKSNAQIDDAWLTGVANDLLSARGASLVLVGNQQPAAVQALVLAINETLGNLGSTLNAVQTGRRPAASIADLAGAIKGQHVRTLLVLGGNPAYDAPADLAFSQLLASVPTTLHLSPFEDETSKLCKWSVPAAHYLESWGDVRTYDGTYTAIQPMILPLWNGVSQLEILAQLAGRPKPAGPELVRETFQTISGTSGEESDEAWNEFLRNGFLANSGYAPASVSLNAGGITSAFGGQAAPGGGTEVVFLQSSSVDDGRYANNSWLQETPDFESKLTWDNAALMSYAMAKSLGVKDGDWVEITSGGKSIKIPALIAPGHAEDSISIALGYGRKDVSALMQNVGFDVYPLRTSTGMRFVTGVSVKAADGKRYPLARPQETWSMEGRDLVREGTLETFEHNPEFAQKMGMDSHIPPEFSLYKNPYFQPHELSKEQWAMTVDLNICSGCNACVVACQAENNVPVVGKDQVIRGRDMAWIRIDRYFAAEPGTDRGDRIETQSADPEMLAQLITCQQCENAPCETVCPVNATVHSEDGLNLMAYNRCIGTRYCANNCPWKVRRFNYFDYNKRPIDELYWGPIAKAGMADSLKMQKNPNVTVRMRGVMEKCTFCIQRIEEAKISRLVKAGPTDKNKTPIAPFKVACQQACPADAIVFGDENDVNSRVHKLRKSKRGYRMLEYLNARPRITYLARIKNPNPAMPGAARVGNINSPDHHGHHGEEHAHAGHVPTGALHGAGEAHH
jgi:Fe-S-cluster-containing hydrogenase components 1